MHNKVNSAVTEKLIRTLKTKIYKYMTSISKNVYVDKLDDIVNECDNTYHRTIKMKPVDDKDNTYIDSMELSCSNDKDPKVKVGDQVRISKCKNIFAKECTPNWSENVVVIKKVKNTVSWTYVINDLNGDDIIGTYYEKELRKTNQEKGNKLYIKWEGYNSSFNSWIDKKNLIK